MRLISPGLDRKRDHQAVKVKVVAPVRCAHRIQHYALGTHRERPQRAQTAHVTRLTLMRGSGW